MNGNVITQRALNKLKHGMKDGTGQNILFVGKALEKLQHSLSDEPLREEKLKPASIPPELFMEWDALDKGNKLAKIKAENITLYCILFYEKFGKWPEGFDKIDHNLKPLYDKALKEYKIKEYSKMTWDELSKKNLAPALQQLAPEIYKEKFYKKHGVYPTAIY